MNKLNPMISSLTQSIYDCVSNLLEEFKQLEPEFNYKLFYGSNYDFDRNRDIFNVVLSVGAIDRIPSHYEYLGEKESLMFAGTCGVNLTVINPLATRYGDNTKLTEIKSEEINYDYYDNPEDEQTNNYSNGEDFDEIYEIDEDKIQNGVRILEALSMFMYRKSMSVNDFHLTFLSNIPEIDGEMDNQGYRLIESFDILCKFQQTTDFNLYNGEDIQLFINFGTHDNPNWEKLHCLADFRISFSGVSDSFPLSDYSFVQNQINQTSSTISCSSPAISNIGASKIIKDYYELGEIEKLQDLEIKYTEDNGKTFKTCLADVISFDFPRAIDQFGSMSFVFHVKSKIETI